MKNKRYKYLLLVVVLVNTVNLVLANPLTKPPTDTDLASSEKRNKLIEIQLNNQRLSTNTQDAVVQLDDQTALALQTFQNTLREIALTEKYNQTLLAQTVHQQQQIKVLTEQRESLVQVRQKLTPTMHHMITALHDFIALDVPFLWQERQLRIKALKAAQLDPEIPISEKIRRILEAYQIEVSYGYDIESWQEALPHSNSKQLVTLLRIGRTALYYLTPDQDSGGIWDQENRRWLPVTSAYIDKIITAIKVAENTASPQLLSLPVVIK